MEKQPTSTGWYWFLPDENCPTPTGLLRIDMPVVVLVGQERFDRAGPPPRLVVRFTMKTMYCDELSGDWVKIKAPRAMHNKAIKRRKLR